MHTHVPGQEDSWQLGQHQLHGPERGHRQWPEVGDSLWEIHTFDLHYHNWDISNRIHDIISGNGNVSGNEKSEMFRYMFLSGNDKVVRAKKASAGVHICKTTQVRNKDKILWCHVCKIFFVSSLLDFGAKMIPQAVILATYSEPIVPEQV